MLNEGNTIVDNDGKEYKVGTLLGFGGLGIVYEAIKKEDKKKYAVKTFLPNKYGSIEVLLNEGGMTTNIQHPNVIEYFFFNDGSTVSLPPYILMEYAPDGSLSDFLHQQITSGSLPSNNELISIFRQLIDGMKAVNSCLVHRDIKPDNILLKNDQWKITDFGLAKVAEEATRVQTFKGGGTDPYMAPEIWKGQKNTIQVDIYAMGIIFYQLATNRFPFKVDVSNNITEAWKKAHLYQTPLEAISVNTLLSTNLSILISKMLEKNTNKRCSSWEEIDDLLGKDVDDTISIDPSIQKVARILHTKKEAQTRQQLIREKDEAEREEFLEMFYSQVENEITNEINAWINEFNTISPIGRANLIDQSIPSKDVVAIRKIDRNRKKFILDINNAFNAEISISPLYRFTWQVDVPKGYGQGFRTVQVEPKLHNKKIWACGTIKLSNEKGIHIFWLESNSNIYGEWVVMKNYNNIAFMTGKSRTPEPFLFSESELQSELEKVGSVHTFRSEFKPLCTKEDIIDFVVDEFSAPQ